MDVRRSRGGRGRARSAPPAGAPGRLGAPGEAGTCGRREGGLAPLRAGREGARAAGAARGPSEPGKRRETKYRSISASKSVKSPFVRLEAEGAAAPGCAEVKSRAWVEFSSAAQAAVHQPSCN